MNQTNINDLLENLLDALAAIEHERWSHWQQYMHHKGKKQKDGSLVLPAELVNRWERQIATPFEGLSDKEKDSDREQVRRYLSLIVDTLNEEMDVPKAQFSKSGMLKANPVSDRGNKATHYPAGRP